MSFFDMIVFTLALHTAVGADGLPGEVPLEYGVQVYQASQHHGVDPAEMGALLLAENRGRRYDPTTVGRYGKGGEAGLFQLVGTWANEAEKRCSFEKERYEGLEPCLVIPEDAEVHYECDEEGCLDLFDAEVNIEAAVIAVVYMKYSHEEGHEEGEDADWRTHYRCSNEGSARQSKGCLNSVKRVLVWEDRLRDEIEMYQDKIDGVTNPFVQLKQLFMPETDNVVSLAADPEG